MLEPGPGLRKERRGVAEGLDALLPGLQHATLLGIPVAIVAVLWPPFPLFVAIALVYTRRAEALEDAFRELVEPPR